MLSPPSNPRCPACGTHLPMSIGREQWDELLAILQRIDSRLTNQPGTPKKSPTDPRIERIAELEIELAYMQKGDRARLIQDKLGLSQSNFYRLRANALSIPTIPADVGNSECSNRP